MKTKAVRMYGTRDLRLEEFELPEIKDDEILVKVMSDSICMSTYKLAEQGKKHKRAPQNIDTNPIIIGHEFAGVIVKVGAKWQDQFKPGQKFAQQPALNYKGSLASPGYSYEYFGGACTYCIIPKLRGKFRSVPMERLIAQAEDMAEQGVKELILVAQETTVYGKDLYGKKSLHILLKKLCEIRGIRWIRILYCYPEEIYDELIETIRDEKKICHYLDIPIQHASDRILKRMGRRTSKQELIDIVGKLRKEIPDIVLRTTLITGFPGETEEDHEELKEFVDEMEFDRLGVFTYSPEENTPAAEMADQVPEEVKEERRDELMELQQEISYDRGQDRIGQELLVMIEGKVADESAYIGRTYGDAPKVDGYIFVQTGELLMTGDFAKVRVTGALEYDLIGVLSDEYTE